MSDYNVFTQWRHRLHFDHAADVREWFGYFRYDTCHDADIGMALNGLQLDRSFGHLAPKSELPRALPQKLRLGFVPEVSDLASAIFDISHRGSDHTVSRPTATGTTEALTSHNDVVKAFSRAVAPNVDRFVEKVLSARTRHVDELLKLIQENPPWPPIGTNDIPFSTHQVNLPPLTTPSGRPYEEILAAAQKIEAWRAAERARHLTDAQVMQLCMHFKLYSLAAIEQFIQEYQR